MLGAVFLMLWMMLKAAKGSYIGRIMHHVMVVLPATAANRATRVHVAIAMVVMVGVVISCVAGENDPVRMLVVLAPDLALWLTSLEIGALLEAAAAGTAAVMSLRRLDIRSYGIGIFFRRPHFPRNVSRAPRSKPRADVSSSNDDEDCTAVASAA